MGMHRFIVRFNRSSSYRIPYPGKALVPRFTRASRTPNHRRLYHLHSTITANIMPRGYAADNMDWLPRVSLIKSAVLEGTS